MQVASVRRRKRVIYLNLTTFYNYISHKGIVEYAVDNNWSLTYLATKPSQQLLKHLKHFDGAIVHMNSKAVLTSITDQVGIPLVSTNLRTRGTPVKHVVFNDDKIGEMACDHLVDKGFKRLIMIRSAASRGPARNITRYVALCKAAERHKKVTTQLCSVDDLTPNFLKQVERPFGIILINDSLAPEVMFRLDDARLSIPLDAAVLGIDNNPLYCDSASTPLSSIKINAAKRGKIAATYLDQMMSGIDVPVDTVYVDPEGVVERASTNICAIPHPPTVRALQYIEAHLDDHELSVGQVAAHSGISRRGLETAFTQYLNRSIASEIHRQRLDWAVSLIRDGDKSIQEIATTCGFSSPQAMSRIFRRKLGRTPTSYKPGESGSS